MNSLGDFIRHMGVHIDGFDGYDDGGYGVNERNLEGKMLLEFFLNEE